MTREKQIKQAGIEYTIGTRPICIGGGAFSKIVDEMNRNRTFEEGAKWADEHPNLTEEEQVGMGGLGMIWQKKHLIDEACEWLEQHLDEYYQYGPWSGYSVHLPSLINDFKKAMECDETSNL